MNRKQAVEMISAIVDRWHMDSIRQDWPTSATDQSIIIGVVGEYSCGKSTLLNALLGAPDLLPRELKPTTGIPTLIEVTPDVAAVTRMLFKDEAIVADVTPELWRTAIEQDLGMTPVVRVPVSTTFHPGFVLVDTPGIGSLSAGHRGRLNKMMKHMQGAILCVDIQHGTLTEPVKRLLADLVARVDRDAIMLVLTKSDLVDPTELPRIRTHMTSEFAKALGLASPDVRSRVAVACGEPDQPEVEDAVHVIQQTFYAMKTVLTTAALELAQLELVPRVQTQLIALDTEMSAAGGETERRLGEALDGVQQARIAQAEAHRSVRRAVEELRSTLIQRTRDLRETLANAKEAEVIETTLISLDREFLSVASEFGEVVVPSLSGLSTRLAEGATRADALATQIARLTHAAIIAAALPAAAVSGNLVEGALPYVARAIVPVLVADDAATPDGQDHARGPVNNAKLNVAARSLHAVGRVVQVFQNMGELSPITALARLGTEYWRAGHAQSLIASRFDSAVAGACKSLETTLHRDFIKPSEDAVRDCESRLQEIQRYLSEGYAEDSERMEALARDLAEVRLIALSFVSEP
jgi:GTPase SAR1 family protein